MHRIQVQITEKQERQLKELAKLRGASISALIRESVDRLLKPDIDAMDDLWQRSLEVLGKYSSGKTDISARHDDYFAEAILEQNRHE